MEAGLSEAPAPARTAPDLERWGPSIAIALLAAMVVATGHLLGFDGRGPEALVLVPFGVLLAIRHPVAATVALFVVLGFSGTLLAFTPITPRPAAQFALLSLWAGVVFNFLTGDRSRIWLWPGVVAPALYVALTLIEALLTDPISVGWESFRQSILWMSGFVMVALSPWARRYRHQLAWAAVGIGIATGAYALFRYVVGPAESENALARTALAGLPQSTELRFFGSQATAQQLALWASTLLPVVLALALAWRGRMRLLAALAVGLLGFTLIATEVRTGAVAGAVAVAVCLLLFQLCVAFPGGTRLGTTATAVVAIAVLGLGGFALSIGRSDDRVDRFLRIFSPKQDQAYSTRIERWRDAWPEITERPLGQGLGNAGVVAAQDEFVPLTATNLDSSYLKVGLEQGVAVMVFFFGGLCLLLVTLARRAVGARDPTRAALAIGACGTLAATMVMFYAGFYIENLQILMPWLLIGLGVAQFSVLEASDAEHPGAGAAAA